MKILFDTAAQKARTNRILTFNVSDSQRIWPERTTDIEAR